jgi:uroporphyrinogen-III synthase
MRFKVPEGLKYFCQSEAEAFICKICLQKTENLCRPKGFLQTCRLDKKYKDENFFTASDQLNADATTTLNGLTRPLLQNSNE